MWSWIWQNIKKIEKLQGYLVFGEWMRVQHNIPYDNLPDWFITFDVWVQKQQRFMDYDEKTKFLNKLGFHQPPIINRGHFTKELIPRMVDRQKSRFCSTAYIHGMNFTKEERNLILHPRIKGIQYHRFPDGEVFREGCVIKRIHNSKYGRVKGTKKTKSF